MPWTNAERATEHDLAQAEKEPHEPPTKPMLSAQDERDEEIHANTNVPADPSAGPIMAAREPLRTEDSAANTFVPIPLEPANTTVLMWACADGPMLVRAWRHASLRPH